MTDKPKNDNRSSIHRSALMVSMGLNAILIVMLILLYIVTMTPDTPISHSGPPDAFQLSATALIASATESRKIELGIPTTPTATPMPPLSLEDKTALRNQYLSELETELGFLHPVLEDAIDSYVNSIRYELDATGVLSTNTPNSIIEDIDRTTFENVEYAAVVVPLVKGAGATSGFIFSFQNGTPELLAQDGAGVTIEPFADRNGNGFPDIALRITSLGGYVYQDMSVYEIRSGNEFVNLTENLNATIWRFIDLDADGIMELEGRQRLWIPEGVLTSRGSPYQQLIPRWFKWNGEAYEPLPVIESE